LQSHKQQTADNSYYLRRYPQKLSFWFYFGHPAVMEAIKTRQNIGVFDVGT
jgi:hypothetical protein